MANAMENALKRIAESKEFKQAQETLKNSGISPAANDNSQVRPRLYSAEKINQTIEEAKQNIPAETMKEVAENSAPLDTPSQKRPVPYGLESKRVDGAAHETIEKMEQAPDHSYRKENAMDRALAKKANPPQEQNLVQEKAKTR